MGVLLPMWLCYLSGTILGAYLETVLKVYALALPASLTMSVGLVYLLFRRHLKGYLRRIEHEQLGGVIRDMQQTMERTKTYLKGRKGSADEQQGGGFDEDQVVIDLDQEMGNM